MVCIITKQWGDNNPKVLDIRATFLARAGRYKEAVIAQKKAIVAAKGQKDNAAMTDSVISDMAKKAEEYGLRAGTSQ